MGRIPSIDEYKTAVEGIDLTTFVPSIKELVTQGSLKTYNKSKGFLKYKLEDFLKDLNLSIFYLESFYLRLKIILT
jgi:hypothetical protein